MMSPLSNILGKMGMILHQVWLSTEYHKPVLMIHLIVRLVFVLSQCEELSLTMGAHHDRNSNLGSHGCEPSGLPLSSLMDITPHPVLEWGISYPWPYLAWVRYLQPYSLSEQVQIVLSSCITAPFLSHLALPAIYSLLAELPLMNTINKGSMIETVWYKIPTWRLSREINIGEAQL